jgi:uncharacterized Zn finger protein (UPF0148 family)
VPRTECPTCKVNLIQDPQGELPLQGLCPECGVVHAWVDSEWRAQVYWHKEPQLRQSQPGERPSWSRMP